MRHIRFIIILGLLVIFFSNTKADSSNKNMFNISFGLSVNLQPENNHYIINTDYYGTPVTFDLTSTERHTQFGMMIDVSYNIFNRLSLGADVTMSKFSFNNKEFILQYMPAKIAIDYWGDIRLLNYDYNFNLYSSHLKLQYFLNNKYRYQPFISMGGGVIKYSVDPDQVISGPGYDPGGTVTDIFKTFKENFSSMQLVSEFGCRIQPSINSSVILTIKTNLSYNTKESNYINRLNYALILAAGFQF